MPEILWSILSSLLTILSVNSYATADTEAQNIYGILDHSIPVQLSYTNTDGELVGQITYGHDLSNQKPLEGRLEDGSFVFYEIAGDAVSSVIKGSAHSDSSNWTWSRYNYSLQLPFQRIHIKVQGDHEVTSYASQDKNSNASAILIPNTQQLNVSLGNSMDFRWMSYNCVGSDCYEIRPDENLDNPLEFSLEEDQIKIFPNNILESDHSIQYKNVTIDSNTYLLSYNYPSIDGTFDHWANNVILNRIESDKRLISNNKSDSQESGRLSDRHYGNFFISLLSDKLVSGYLVFHSASDAAALTVPFTYNRNKSKFINLKEVFKNDFDYTFFLKKYLASEKRKLIYQEDTALKDVVKNDNFGHYAFTPQGLVFFTEFNTLFGRRNMHVPFSEISSFISDKTLSSYISKLN